MNFFSLERQKPASFDSTSANDKKAADAILHQRKKRVDGISVTEVARHNKRDDCWMILENKVYDVTSWVDKHPGGEVILSYAGLDATDVFAAFHAESSYKILPAYYIGEVTDLEISPSLKEHRLLFKALKEEKFFESSKAFYIYKLMTNLTLVTLSFLMMAYFGHTLFGKAASVLFVGFFWQQCGWLSHDFLHHQVFQNRKYNNWMGLFLGNFCQGFSVSWWKNKHNTHHAVPNVSGLDPDIDTMPFLAWSEKLIEGDLSGLPQFMIKYQYLTYLPLLCIARISWLIQSFVTAKHKLTGQTKQVELYLLIGHYIWVSILAFSWLSIGQGILFILASQAVTGLLLSTAFSLNHNGMHILDAGSRGDMDFNRMQVITGRDVNGGPFNFVHWFMGGLDMQIEHHLFPLVPRHNLKKIQQRVIAICDKHGIDYHRTGFWQGTQELFQRLYDVSGSL